MINWVECNFNAITVGLFTGIIMSPVSYLFCSIMDRFKKKNTHIKKKNTHKKKKQPKRKTVNENKSNEHNVQTVIKEKKVCYNSKQDESSNLFFAIIFMLLIAGVIFFYKNKELITNIIYVLAWFGFWTSLIMLIKEKNDLNRDSLKLFLGWISVTWLYGISAIHLFYHPIYYIETAKKTEEAILQGKGVFNGGVDGFFYLSYQFIGVVVLVAVLLYILLGQIYALVIWWNDSGNMFSKFKLVSKIITGLKLFYTPNWKFIISSLILIIISFLLMSGIAINIIGI